MLVLLTCLAAWRLASLLVNEDGPFDIFQRLRHIAGIEEIQTITVTGMQTGYVAHGPIAKGLLCVWCTSVWCATGLWLAMLIPGVGQVVTVFTQILAISAGAIIIHVIVERIKGAE